MEPTPELATDPVKAPFWGARALPVTDRLDYEDGPIGIQDTSQGLHVQPWRARLVNGAIYLAAANFPEQKIIDLRCIDSFSFSFDQNARYLITYVQDGNLYLYWYDPIAFNYVHTLLDTGVITPRITLDDKRRNQQDSSNVRLFYVKDATIIERRQSDRYGIPYSIFTGIGGRLLRVGMNIHYRLQLFFEAAEDQCTSCTVPWRCP